MKASLIIQHFGPITDVHLEIRRFNILIGPQAAGKSTISKVLAVIHSFTPSNNTASLRGMLITLLTYYRLEKFLKEDTYWRFEDERLFFEMRNRNDGDIRISYKQDIQTKIGKDAPYYFPAERVALPMISESLFELTLEQSSLPGYFLQFGKDFSISRREQQSFNIPLLDVAFEYNDGKYYVLSDDGKMLALDETSSAVQANLPLLVILQHPVKAAPVFVIEELELHGFPSLQKELLYHVVETIKDPHMEHAYVMLPTHSPYILSAANNLLLAAKVGAQNAVAVADIINEKAWIEKEEFSAYYINDGTAVSIVDDKLGMIDENQLDNISEDLGGEFDALMEFYKPNK